VPAITLHNLALRGVVCSVPGEPLTIKETGGAFTPEESQKVASLAGVETVYRASEGTTTSDLCIGAARHLLLKLGWEASSVEGLIVVTQTPDYFLPNDASVAHLALGLSKSCFAFDVNMGCGGFLYGLWITGQSVSTGSAKRVLLLTGDTLSRVVSPRDRSSLLFGDAGSAAAIEWDADALPTTFVVGSDGRGAHSLMVPAGAFRDPRRDPESYIRVPDLEGNERSVHDLYMNGWDVFNFTIREVPGLVKAVLEKHGWSMDQVNWVLLHQANKMIIEHLARRIGAKPSNTPVNIQRYGNTSGVSIPLLMADDLGHALVSASQRLLLAGYGVGYAWAGAAMTVGPLAVSEVVHVPQS